MLGPWFWSLILALILVPNHAPDFGPPFCPWIWSPILPLGLHSTPGLSPISAPGSLRGSVGGGLPSHRSRGEEASKPENSLQPSLGNSPESATNTKAPSQTIPLRYLWETEHSTRTLLIEILKRNNFNGSGLPTLPLPQVMIFHKRLGFFAAFFSKNLFTRKWIADDETLDLSCFIVLGRQATFQKEPNAPFEVDQRILCHHSKCKIEIYILICKIQGHNGLGQ